MFNWKVCLVLLFSTISTQFLAAATIDSLLRVYLPEATINVVTPSENFEAAFEIMLPQPLDHKNPQLGTFDQRIILYHKGLENNTLMVTAGYSAGNRESELAAILDANQIVIEYRFFGASIPDKMDWQYLKNDQAIQDLHRVRTLFQSIYNNQWISTGISKGGTTALIYKSQYPDDVAATVAYVAPLALAQEDKRTNEHLSTVGSDACRHKITTFQRAGPRKKSRDA